MKTTFYDIVRYNLKKYRDKTQSMIQPTKTL